MSEELLPSVSEPGFEIKYFLRLSCEGGTWFACLCNLPDFKLKLNVYAQEVKEELYNPQLLQPQDWKPQVVAP